MREIDQARPTAARAESVRHAGVRVNLSRSALVVAALAGYCLAFGPVYHAAGAVAGVLSVVPVVMAGGLLGLRWGEAMALLLFPIENLLYAWADPLLANAFRENIIATVVMVVLGGASGRLRDLSVRVQAQARALQEHAAVRARTETERLQFALEQAARTQRSSGIWW